MEFVDLNRLTHNYGCYLWDFVNANDGMQQQELIMSQLDIFSSLHLPKINHFQHMLLDFVDVNQQ